MNLPSILLQVFDRLLCNVCYENWIEHVVELSPKDSCKSPANGATGRKGGRKELVKEWFE